MRKKIFVPLLAGLAVLSIAGCDSYTPSDLKYWFSSCDSESIGYDENLNNIDEAGTYWNFVSAKNADITMNLIMNVDNFSSAAYLYLNGEQVKSEVDTGIYTYVFTLTLKKNDELSLHAFYVNPLYYEEGNEFSIQAMAITAEDGKTYLLNEFNNLGE